MNEISLVGTRIIPTCQEPCIDCVSQKCEDCCVGAHQISSFDFWGYVGNFFGPNIPPPLRVSRADMLTQVLQLNAPNDEMWATFDADRKYNIGNIFLGFGIPPSNLPNVHATYQSISLMKGVLNNFPLGANFNFYIGQTVVVQQGYFVLFSVTTINEQELYYCDVSGLHP